MIEKIYILENRKIDGIEKEKKKIEEFLKSCGKVVENSPENVDLIISLGGDGTLLKAAHLSESDTLIYGIKFGKVGFLTNSPDNVEKKLQNILKGDFKVSERMVLKITLKKEGKVLNTDFALNDCVVFRKGIRIIDMEIKMDSEIIYNLRGDGIIFSTPTGSTAHSLSAGGPVIFPEMEAILIIPVCPYTLGWRSVILSPDKIYTLKISSEGEITVDGQRNYQIDKNFSVEITSSEKKAKIIMDDDKFFERLSSKFNWSK